MRATVREGRGEANDRSKARGFYYVIIKRLPLTEVPMGGSGSAKKHALPTTTAESAAAAASANKSKLTTGGGWGIGASLTSIPAGTTTTSTEDVELANLKSRVVNLDERVSLLEATPV